MSSAASSAGAATPRVLFAMIAVYLAGFGFVAWDQSYWWREQEDYGFGWLMPACVLYLGWDRWPRLVAGVRACAQPGSPRMTPAGERVGAALSGAALALGAASFLLGAGYRAAIGASHLGTWCITVGAIALVGAAWYRQLPEAVAPRRGPVAGDARLAVLALGGFPLAGWLLAAPLLSGVEQFLNRILLGQIMGGVALGFQALGLDFQREGNVIVTPGGRVGVLEACAGLRSLVGCLLAGSFLAAALLERRAHRWQLLGLAVVLALAANFVRAAVLAWAVHRYGVAAVEGVGHETAGWVVWAATVAGLVGFVWWRRRGAARGPTSTRADADRRAG